MNFHIEGPLVTQMQEYVETTGMSRNDIIYEALSLWLSQHKTSNQKSLQTKIQSFQKKIRDANPQNLSLVQSLKETRQYETQHS